MHKSDVTPAGGLKKWIVTAITLFISFQSVSQMYTVDSILRNGRRSNRINLVYLSDGFKSEQLPIFKFYLEPLIGTLFNQTPFKQYQSYFNAYGIRVPSADTGAIHPATADDEAAEGMGQPVSNPNTFFRSTFDYGSFHRSLIPLNTAAVYDVLANNLPEYTVINLVVNTAYYGGASIDNIGTTSLHYNFNKIAIHELGHSLAGLQDEYWPGTDGTSEAPNMTANSILATVKWKNWVGENGIFHYPYGSSGDSANWYRPHQGCRMRYLDSSFCAVCIERFIDVIHQRINMIDAHTPVSTSFALTNTNPVNFSVTAIPTDPSTIGIKWFLNGRDTPFATNQYAVSVPFEAFNNGYNVVSAEITDSTALSRSYLPGAGYLNMLSWVVNTGTALPIHLLSFSGRENNNRAALNWEIDTPGDLQVFELQKSRDGIGFTRLASVGGEASKKNYSYTDEQLFAPYTYYRLKIIEKSGSFNYTNTIRIQHAFDKFYYKVYQDAGTHQYHLLVRLSDPKRISFTVSDVSGKTVIKKDLGKIDQQAAYNFDLAGKPAGIYLMRLYFNDYAYTIQLVAR